MKKLLLITTLTLLTTNLCAIELPAENCFYNDKNYVLVSYDYEDTSNNPLPKINNFLFTAVVNGEVVGMKKSLTVPLLKSGDYIDVSSKINVEWTLRHSKELKTLIVKNTKTEYQDFLLQKVGDNFVELHNHYYMTEDEKAELINNKSNYNAQRDMKYGVIPAFKYQGVAYEICIQ